MVTFYVEIATNVLVLFEGDRYISEAAKESSEWASLKLVFDYKRWPFAV